MPVFVLHFEQNHLLHSDHRRLPVRHTRRMFSEHRHHPIHHTQRFSPNRRFHPIRQIRSSPSNRRLHPIHHVRCPHLPARSALPNVVADPVVRPLSASFTIRTRSRILRSPAGFRLPLVECLGVPTLSAPRLTSVGSPLSSERALVLRSFDDPITRFVFRSVPRTLPKRYVAPPTSMSVSSEARTPSSVARCRSSACMLLPWPSTGRNACSVPRPSPAVTPTSASVLFTSESSAIADVVVLF
jgi:hypothetical protein